MTHRHLSRFKQHINTGHEAVLFLSSNVKTLTDSWTVLPMNMVAPIITGSQAGSFELTPTTSVKHPGKTRTCL